MHINHPLFLVTFLLLAAAASGGMRVREGTFLHRQDGPGEMRDSLQLRQGIVPTGEQSAVFSSVESGILAGNAGSLSSFFSACVFIQLRGTEGGYFSAAQSHYILETFLKGKKALSARFTTYGMSDLSPYATGSASFIVKGKRENAQMYVALSQVGGRWVISHLSIY